MMRPASYQFGFAPRDGIPAFPDIWRGCVGAWAPCLGQSGLQVKEWAGGGKQGVMTNMTPLSDWSTPGGIRAVRCNGTNSSVITSSLGVSTQFATITCWFYLTGALNADSGLVISRSDSQIGLFESNGATNTLAASWNGSAGEWGANTGLVPLQNAWNFAAMTVSRDLLTVYLNGASFNITITPTRRTLGVFHFGNDPGLAGRFCSCFIGEVRIYSRALAVGQLVTLRTRPGIAYELAPRRRVSSGNVFNRRRRLLVGAGS